ncbi:hypothetical protein [Candidatus Poriferisocius sp.]|uniref:hypothetical protein n=1 Tax=Candidatus Poriferisocius sp. TaxID=3101276 RepID=UPI003B5298EF
MPSSVVCDAGGVLAVAGVLKGTVPIDAEFLALDWSAMTVGRFVAARHEGNPERIQVEIGLALSAVHEWFPVRTIVVETLSRAGRGAADALDSWSALILAETLDLPLFTASDEVGSNLVEVHRPW